jgi:hypothetical protein
VEQYKEYIGKEYCYGAKNFKINEVKKVQGKTVVKTSARTYVFYESDAINFFKDLKPYVNKMKTIISKDSEYNKTNSDHIKDVLFEAIEKVKKDKDYVQQANAICNLTSQLINIKKLELKH